ncbi:GNAT family N-acetyltransferase [Candidatus Parcubacteria bacterium]|jgi:hypothetical protein|nr:GNAT family N-acetyltransferase [Candidatus Parcubacteria bacterium]
MFIHKSIPSTVEATRVAAAAFVRTYSQALYEDVAQHLAEGNVYTIFDGVNLAGFAIFNMVDHETLYLAGIILLPDIQGQGIAADVVRMAQEETGAKKLMLRTQSLRMWSVGNKLCHTWFPQHNSQEGYYDHGCFPWSGPFYTPSEDKSEIIRAFYDGPLYGQKPTHRNRPLQKWWDSICDFDRGDAVVCYGEF